MIRGNCTRIGEKDEETAFIDRTLTSIENNTVTKIENGAFSGCTSLQDVSFPAVTIVSSYAFNNCTSLKNVSIPSATKIYDYAFGYASQLKEITLPSVTKISSYAFWYCTEFFKLYLPSQTVCQLDDVNAFGYTRLGVGYIYVPTELYNDYIADSKWSTYSSRIFAYSFGGQ